jgi:predicted Fe-Mo cluster-binding NifX family protein
MKNEIVAVPVYQERVSPLLDVAKKFALYELKESEIKQKMTIDIHTDDEPQRIDKLKEIGVTVIIGGAVSGFVSEIIREKGIQLISWITGPVDNTIDLYIKDELKPFCGETQETLGCRRRRRQRQCNVDSDK